jgi:hypothetical protein
MISTLAPIGENYETIFVFGAGVLGFLMLFAILIMAIEAIRRFIR